MPSLQGLTETDAKNILNGVGLTMEVRGYKSHATIQAFSVVDQSIPVNTPTDRGAIIYVTLSQGRDFTELPSVIDLNEETAKQNLQEMGFLVATREVWSTKARGLVINQEPPADTLLGTQSVVTLKISGGTKVTTNINFDNQIILSAYEMPRIFYTANEDISLTLFWQILQPPDDNHQVLIEISTLDGQLLAQYQGAVTNINETPRRWLSLPEEIVVPYKLPVPRTITPGFYQLGLGIINPSNGHKLAVVSPGIGEDGTEILILQEIRVN